MSHYFSENQTSELNLSKISDRIKGNLLDFYVGSGVFSKSRVDKGSKILIENCIMEDGWDVLDLGSGYGPIGISLAKYYKNIKVTMVEINKRAVMLAKKNIFLNKISRTRFDVFQGNSYSAITDDRKFNTILLNPPQTAGKQICIDMIEQAKLHLKEGGCLQIIARHNKGGESFQKIMKELYGNAEFICKDKGFRVYVSYFGETNA